MAELRRQLEILRAVSPGQGSQGAPKASEGPVSLAQELLKDGTLSVAAQMAANPEQGLEHAMYAMAEGIEKRMRAEFDQFRSGVVDPIVTRSQQERAIANAFGTAKRLASEFPELDDSNQSEEAEQAQEAILANLQRFPPEMLAQNPEFVLLAATLVSRHQNGVPVFAQPPGTSGSPSVRAAQAAEAAQAATAAVPLDGTGLPRPRTSGVESPQDRMRRENRELEAKALKSPTGRRLWATS
jgi:hypothetical protein